MLGRDVADQLGDDDRLADTGAAEDAGLAALGKRGDEVDDLDAVSKTSTVVACSSKRGAGRWIGYRVVALTGPPRRSARRPH